MGSRWHKFWMAVSQCWWYIWYISHRSFQFCGFATTKQYLDWTSNSTPSRTPGLGQTSPRQAEDLQGSSLMCNNSACILGFSALLPLRGCTVGCTCCWFTGQLYHLYYLCCLKTPWSIDAEWREDQRHFASRLFYSSARGGPAMVQFTALKLWWDCFKQTRKPTRKAINNVSIYLYIYIYKYIDL